MQVETKMLSVADGETLQRVLASHLDSKLKQPATHDIFTLLS
jgi:hypothetical protein